MDKEKFLRTIGRLVCAEICELIGTYLWNKMAEILNKVYSGFFRHGDSLVIKEQNKKKKHTKKKYKTFQGWIVDVLW